MPQIIVNIEQDLKDFLMNECEVSNRTVDEVVEAALDKYLEDQQDVRVAIDVLADIKAGRMDVVPWEEVKAAAKINALEAEEELEYALAD